MDEAADRHGGIAKKDRVTRRIPFGDVTEIEGEVKEWLEAASDRDAGG